MIETGRSDSRMRREESRDEYENEVEMVRIGEVVTMNMDDEK